MSARYVDFGYTEPGPANGRAGASLAATIVRLVCGLGGVRAVCDLGCGNGYLAAKLAHAGCHVIGVDASASGILLANTHHAGERVRFVRAELGSEAIRTLESAMPFDVVVSSDVIEHLYRPAVLVESAAALLKPGGRLVLGTPYHGYLKNVAISALGRWDAHHGVHWDGGHIKFFSARTLTQLVERHGFRVTRVHRFGRLPGLWKHMVCVATRVGPC